MATPPYLPYHEPSLLELLISSSFLLALNGINSVLDRTLACGLVGQVLVGTAWGVSGAGWLSIDFQRIVSSFGYLGLILVVYAGGVETDVVALRKNLVLSVAVAITGVIVPIALSFALLASAGTFLGRDGGAAPLQAFAAGAALCSTSLGTTFSVLQASGLSRTRLGAVLASAALLDDVVGLVMVRIITSLGPKGNNSIKVEPATILRPVLVSVAFAVGVPLACRCVLEPGQRVLDRIIHNWQSKGNHNSGREDGKKARVAAWIGSQEAAFVIQTALLILLIVAADYAGASILLAAYLAGVVVSWWHGPRGSPEILFQSQSVGAHSAEISTPNEPRQDSGRQMLAEPGSRASSLREREVTSNDSSTHTKHQELALQKKASRVFDTYYAQAVHRLLKPFFFASIGFSIPISNLFHRKIIWRGIIYSIIMVTGKLVCGLWLVRFPILRLGMVRNLALFIASKYDQTVCKVCSWGFKPMTKLRAAQEFRSTEVQSMQTVSISMERDLPPASSSQPRATEPTTSSSATPGPSLELNTPSKPLSLYPAAVLGCAMVARGEIGFLISAMAESQGVFRRPDENNLEASELFLIVTWAIFLCTILGPLCTGLIVRRIKKLTKASEASRGGARNVLGVWGIG